MTGHMPVSKARAVAIAVVLALPGAARAQSTPVAPSTPAAVVELDKLLGLGLVPPTVERRIDGRDG